MGGVVSSGANNDDLIDNLLEADYIKSSTIERVFRAVDRAEYFLPEARINAYNDLAWKNGNLHLSAPCIYSEVMEGLCLKPGLSFLNLGSGTGYLSTMVGLVLGSNGVNHGIEFHEDVVQYANKKLMDFKKFSGAIDEFDFCEPKFIQGNCLCLSSSSCSLYDRVYCGAACPEQYENYMRNLLKVGGILVMPLNDQLLQIKRKSETSFDVRALLPVSFAHLIPPTGREAQVQLIEMEPQTLQAICRAAIRNILRKNIELEHPPVKRTPPHPSKTPKRKRTLRRLVVPLFEEEYDSSDDDNRRVRMGVGRNRDAERPAARDDDDSFAYDENVAFFNFVLPNLSRFDNAGENNGEGRNAEENKTDPTMEIEQDQEQQQNQETVEAVIHNPPRAQRNNNGAQDAQLEAIPEINDVLVDIINVLHRESNDGNSSGSDTEEDVAEAPPSSSKANEERKNKREKFDSGLGDEIIETQTDSSTEDSSRSSTEPVKVNRHEFEIVPAHLNDSSSENEEDVQTKKKVEKEMLMYESQYTGYMKAKIQELPLPSILKRYLNFYRDF